jgi:hypothetical protein
MIAWTGFPSPVAVTSTSVLVGLAGGTTNARFLGNSILLVADNLSTVDDATESFDNISPLTTTGDMLTFNGGSNVRLGIGTAAQILGITAGLPDWIDNPGLLIANNLSDLADVSDALDNLGLNTTDDVSFKSLTVTDDVSGDNVSATDTVEGETVSATGFFQSSVTNAITAHAGGGQGSAVALTTGFNRVTTVATAADSVKLPSAVAGREVVVTNAAAANALNCFPDTGEIINALSANTALSIAANTTTVFFCSVNGTWNSK